MGSVDLVLTYTGYIDRGQRIESRLSQRPIRMTGRVASMIDGITVAQGRFIMARRGAAKSKTLPSITSIPFKSGAPSVSSTTSTSTSASVDCGSADSFGEGERRVVETQIAGAIIVAKLGGEYYAVNAKCPHLGLPMKRGPILLGEKEGDDPTITCNFHNSVFSLKDGSCKTWCSAVMGLPGTQWLASASGKLGGLQNSPAEVYIVTVSQGRVIVSL